jgi:hypothetical protein
VVEVVVHLELLAQAELAVVETEAREQVVLVLSILEEVAEEVVNSILVDQVVQV